jgi:hypothetical protein
MITTNSPAIIYHRIKLHRNVSNYFKPCVHTVFSENKVDHGRLNTGSCVVKMACRKTKTTMSNCVLRVLTFWFWYLSAVKIILAHP